MILTLQFIRPLHREQLMGTILRGLNENDCLILVEKVLGEDSVFNWANRPTIWKLAFLLLIVTVAYATARYFKKSGLLQEDAGLKS